MIEANCGAGAGGLQCGAPPARVERTRAPAQTLLEIVRRHGTPTYAYDLRSLSAQAAKLRDHLPAAVDVFYSLKANPALVNQMMRKILDTEP